MDRLHELVTYVAAIERARGEQELRSLALAALRAAGARRHVLTGLPLPHQPIAPLILMQDWPDARTGRQHGVSADDLVVNKALDRRDPCVLDEDFFDDSPLARAARPPDDASTLIIMPLTPSQGFQAACVFTIETAEAAFDGAGEALSVAELTALRCALSAALQGFAALGLLPKRRGELTSREREIVTHCALGATSAQIARRINISERTVITHLQNAAAKLDAANRAACVTQAIRYEQIGAGAKTHRGFFEIRTEIMSQTDYDAKAYF